MNAPHCYAIRTLLVLFNKPIGIMKQHTQFFVADNIKKLSAVTSFDDYTQLQTDTYRIYKSCILCMQGWCLAKSISIIKIRIINFARETNTIICK
jgi:hypothetical protein